MKTVTAFIQRLLTGTSGNNADSAAGATPPSATAPASAASSSKRTK